MAVALRAVGTVAQAASGNVLPGLPAGTAADDILILVVMNHQYGSEPTVSGYTRIGGADWAAHGYGGVVFGKRAGTGETGPTVTNNGGGAILARIAGYSGAITSGTAWENSSGNPTFASTVTALTMTPSVDNCMIVCAGWTHLSTKVATSSFGVFTGSSPSMTEEFDNNFDGGDAYNYGICLDDGLQGTAAATGSRTAALPSTQDGGAITIAIKPPLAVVSRGYAYLKALALATP